MSTRTHSRRFATAAAVALLASLTLAPIAARAADPIKIGFSMPLTGGLASNGKAILAAYQMWEEDINAKGGLLGRPVKLVYYDDQSNPSVVPAIYAKLFDVDKVDLVFTSYGTNLAVPSMPVVIPHNYVLLGLFALAVNSEFNYPYYFSMFPAGPDAVHEFSRGYFEIAREQKLQTVAIAGADSDFAKKAADGARENATKAGFKIVYDRSYPPNTVDFTAILRGIQASNPDFVYVASYPTESVGIVRAANETGLKTKLFGGGMVGLQYAALKTQLGELLNKIVDYDFYVPEPTVPFKGIDSFLARYQAKAASIGADLLGYFIPPFAYANGQVAEQAVTAVGSLDQRKLGDYIKSHAFDTIVGKVEYAPNGEWKNPRVLWVQYQNIKGNGLDQFKRAGTQTIIYPSELASGKLQFPYSEGR
jgi:branched-chain amino acid transport system substrate-binding protein